MLYNTIIAQISVIAFFQSLLKELLLFYSSIRKHKLVHMFGVNGPWKDVLYDSHDDV